MTYEGWYAIKQRNRTKNCHVSCSYFLFFFFFFSEPAYNVNWSLEENGFIDGNISFNGPNIYIAESGIYKISVSLQMEVKQQDRGTICTLVLNSSKNQYTIPKKYNIPPNATSHYRLVMSLNLGLKLEAEQYLYISISPRNYLCPDKNTSTFFIHKL